MTPTCYFCLRGRILDGHRHQVGANRSHLIPTQTSSGPDIRSPISFRRPTRPPVAILYPSFVFSGISCVRGAQNLNAGRIRANFRPRGRIFVPIFNEELPLLPFRHRISASGVAFWALFHAKGCDFRHQKCSQMIAVRQADTHYDIYF